MANFKHRRNQIDEADVDMTPMLDIVFIMLIFFIVTATFLDESGLDFAAPADGPTGIPTSTIQIYVDGKDRVSVDRVPVTLSAVPSRVERLLADKPDASILLMASSRATVDPVVFIKDQMAIANRRTSLKVVRE
ncbi:MAG: ExbD/TolR family protein [Alphaproteobacteria bacterium]